MDIKIIEIVKGWFNKAEDWQKDLFINLWKGKDINDVKKRALKLAYKEYNIKDSMLVSDTKFPEDIDNEAVQTNSTVLLSVSNIQGVGALTPTKPLEFKDGLNVVYGANGCGKSSYVRVLKKAESPKGNIKIHSNVFEKTPVPPKATLNFSDDGNQQVIEWSMSNEKVCPIRIYDTEVAHRFVNDSTETIYEPKLLHVFSLMVNVFDYLNEETNDEISNKRTQLLPIPSEFEKSSGFIEYNKVDSLKKYNDFLNFIDFSEEEKKELLKIEKNFSDNNPASSCEKLKTQVKIIGDIKKRLTLAIISLDESQVDNFLGLRKNQINTREKFEEFIKQTRSVSLIEGFGSEKWREMWKASENFKKSLDDMSKDVCVLCQQELSSEAKKRYEKFQEVYASKLENEQQEAQKIYGESIDSIRDLIKNSLNVNQVKNELTTNSFDEKTIDYLGNITNELLQRANWLLNYEENVDMKCPDIVGIDDFNNNVNEIIANLETEIASLTDFIENYEKQVSQRLELRTKKWFDENKDSLTLFKEILELENICSKFKTNTLTKTKNQLSEKLITGVYIDRFKKELKALNPSGSIKVELISDGKKGKTSHRVSIRGAVSKNKTEEILSEGEARVVSIAAFLADLNSINKTQAFVFDDPITSLDHNYEDNVAKQLVKLAFERQVIVFTHRLAFAETLKNCMDNELDERVNTDSREFNYVELLSDPLGEPINRGEYGKTNFKSILGELRDIDLPKVKRLKESGDYDLANDKLQSICAQLRKSLEIGVEKVLLDGLVTRYKKEVSMKKLGSIRKIDDEDIKLFENMMTKYSYQEHSQPSEKPILLPTTDEVYNDINVLIDWIKKFNKK